MPDLNEAADNLRAIEAMVEREFARIDVPKAPDVRSTDELGPIPAIRKPVEAACSVLAVVGPAVGLLTLPGVTA